VALSEEDFAKNNLPDVLARWSDRSTQEVSRPRTAQSFCVSKAEIAGNGYDLSLNRYKEVEHEVVEHVPPQEILKSLAELEAKIQKGMMELKEILK
jgi:type I restriction enzyme M protein